MSGVPASRGDRSYGEQAQQRRWSKPFWRRKGGNQRSNDSNRIEPTRKQTFAQQGRWTYEPPRLNDLQHQNRVKTRKFYLKKKPQAYTPHAPRNTTSFIMRAKTSGGIASFVSPTPVTPAVLATPDMSGAASYREGIVEEVNKEWGVNGYGSMNGLIRLRAPEDAMKEDSESDSDVDQGIHVQSVQQLEQRLDQDLNRFEIVYPVDGTTDNGGFTLTGTQLEDQESHIAHLEEENLTLKERLCILQQQVEELKQRLKVQEGGDSLDEMEVCSEKSVGDAASAGQ